MGNIVVSQSRFLVESTDNSTSLIISPLGLEDSGKYSCAASNTIGMSSANVQLIVQSKLVNIETYTVIGSVTILNEI